MMNTKIATLIALTATAFVAAPAFASMSEFDVPTARVSYHDLDLRTPEGAAKLQRRIKSAAIQVCPMESVASSLVGSMTVAGRCRKAAIARVQPQVLAAIDRSTAVAGIAANIEIAAR